MQSDEAATNLLNYYYYHSSVLELVGDGGKTSLDMFNYTHLYL